MLEETEIGEMIRGYRGGEAALGAWMYVQVLSTSHLQIKLTLCDISAATVIETYTDAEIVL